MDENKKERALEETSNEDEVNNFDGSVFGEFRSDCEHPVNDDKIGCDGTKIFQKKHCENVANEFQERIQKTSNCHLRRNAKFPFKEMSLSF